MARPSSISEADLAVLLQALSIATQLSSGAPAIAARTTRRGTSYASGSAAAPAPRTGRRGPLRPDHCGAPCVSHEEGCRFPIGRCHVLTHAYWHNARGRSRDLTPCELHPQNVRSRFFNR